MSRFPFILRVFIKGLILFLALNILFAASNPLPALGKISLYNNIFLGRERFPYGEQPDKAYNLSLYDINAMFAAHEVAQIKSQNEFRVLVFGDSSVWGYLLPNEKTLTGLLNKQSLKNSRGQNIRFYNLGYPTISLTKDLLFMQEAKKYQPDMVIWLTTLEAFPLKKQLDSPIVQNQPELIRSIISTYDLLIDENDQRLKKPSVWDKTIVGQRKNLADIFRLQMYGLMWAATGIDQYYPDNYERPQNDLEDEQEYYGMQAGMFDERLLAGNALGAGTKMYDGTPLLIVNEPIYISTGKNNDVRYNFFYPRWAYDVYRQWLTRSSQGAGWEILDTWDLVPPEMFSNSAIHLLPEGSELLAKKITWKVLEMVQ